MRLALAILCAVFPMLTLAQDRPQRPPNIVFIMADDLGWGELGSYGQTKIRTPHLDRMAQEGLRLTQAYAPAPVCAPTRCSLLTGRHTGHAEIRGNREVRDAAGRLLEGQHPLGPEAMTLPRAFVSAGYRTGVFGKWGIGGPGSTGAPEYQGVQEFFGYLCQREAHSFFPAHLWRNGERVPLNEKPIPGHRPLPTGAVLEADILGERHATEAIVAAALDFLERSKDEPFFLYLPFTEPHVALQPPVRLVATYPEAWDERPYRGQCGYLPHPRPRAAYAAMITHLDENVGRILQRLKDLELDEHTLVIFTSDNGTTHDSQKDDQFGVGGVDARFFDSLGGLRGAKGSLFEGGIRVPWIARWPGTVAPGRVSDEVVIHYDLFKSCAELANLRLSAEARQRLDGRSFAWLLRGEAAPPTARPPLVFAFTDYGGQCAVRLGSYKVMRQKLLTQEPTPWSVFDLATDPRETKDLAQERQDLIAAAKAVLRAEVVQNEVFPLPVP